MNSPLGSALAPPCVSTSAGSSLTRHWLSTPAFSHSPSDESLAIATTVQSFVLASGTAISTTVTKPSGAARSTCSASADSAWPELLRGSSVVGTEATSSTTCATTGKTQLASTPAFPFGAAGSGRAWTAWCGWDCTNRRGAPIQLGFGDRPGPRSPVSPSPAASVSATSEVVAESASATSIDGKKDCPSACVAAEPEQARKSSAPGVVPIIRPGCTPAQNALPGPTVAPLLFQSVAQVRAATLAIPIPDRHTKRSP